MEQFLQATDYARLEKNAMVTKRKKNGRGARDADPSRKRPRVNGMSGLLRLPYEIITTIFILSSNANLPVVCRQLKAMLYHCPLTLKLQWLLHRHPLLEDAFEAGLGYPFFSLELLAQFDRLHHGPIAFTGKTIPSHWFRTDDPSVALALLDRGASPNKPKGYPLIKSAQLGRLEMVRHLVRLGAEPTARNNMALRVCAARNNFAMVNYFLDDLCLLPDSETLKACVQKELWDMVKVLVDHGGIPDMSTIHFA